MTLRAWLALGSVAVWASLASAAEPPLASAQTDSRLLPDSAVILRVDDTIVRAEEFVRAYFDSYPEFRPAADSTGRVEFMNTLINKEILSRVARAARYELSFEDRLVMRQHTDRVLSNLLFQRYVVDSIRIDDAQVRHVLDQYRRALHLRQLSFDDPESASQTRQVLASGKLTWSEAAKRHRVPADSRDADGDIGWIERANFDPSLGLDLFDLKPGQISQVVSDPFGFHVFQVVGERPGRSLDYAAFRKEVSDQLRDRALASGSRRLRDEVGKGMEVVFDTTNLRRAASFFKPARTTTQVGGTPHLEFDPSVPEFSVEDTSRILVRYRNGKISIGDFVHHYSEIPSLMRPNVHTPSLLRNQLEGMVLEPSMARVAVERGIDKDSVAVAMTQERLDHILVDRMYADSISSKVHVSKAERRKFYDQNKRHYVTWSSVRFAALYAPSRTSADSLARRLRAGGRAQDILLADSLAGINRGSIQNRRADDHGPYHQVLFEELKPGGVSVEGPDPQGGFVVLQLLAYDPGHQLSFDEADHMVSESLTNLAEEKLIKQLLARHRPRYHVEAHPELVMRIRLRHPVADANPEGRP